MSPKTAHKPESFISDTLVIRGTIYPVKICHLPHDKLKFYPDNPRMYSALHDGSGKSPTQEDIEQHLQKLEHVKALKVEIEENDGLVDALYVKESTLEVVEGNSRLAAHRMLAEENAVKWAKVKCTLLPKEFDDSAVASLLGKLHLKGKKDWRPYEEASYLHRRHKLEHVSIPDLHKEFHIPERTIKHWIAVIDFMIKHEDDTVERWSHYDELLKSPKIKKALQDHAPFEQAVVERIKEDQLKAVEVRDKVKVICAAKSDKPIKQFIAGAAVDDAFKAAKSMGGEQTALKKLTTFRTWLAATATKHSLKASPNATKAHIQFELGEIKTRAANLLKEIG
jgi:hypothetical protein